MKLNDRYQYAVLCEDAQSKSFLLSFLDEQGINKRKIRVNMSPAGQKCGSDYVRQQYPFEIRLLLSKKHLKLALIVCTDADMLTVEERIKFVESNIGSIIFNRNQEFVIIWVPKHQIENWIHFFREGRIDEAIDYRHSGKPERCKDEAKKMSEYLSSDDVDYEVPHSLVHAKEEFIRFCNLQVKRS